MTIDEFLAMAGIPNTGSGEYVSAGTAESLPAVMNAANEVAVERFRKSEIKFTGIWNIIEKVMSYHKRLDRPSLDAILSADKWARETAVSI